MSNNEIKIVFTGDFCPINRIEKLAIDKFSNNVLNDFADVFKGNDLNVVDLECPLTLSKSARPKSGPHQKAHPATIEILSQANIQLVAMANNHIMDYGAEGVKDTLELCTKKEIQTVGIGSSEEEAESPYIFNKGNKKIAIFNYADKEFLSSPDRTYFCSPINPVNAFQHLARVKGSVDYIVFIVHGGNEFYNLPSPRTRELYRYFVDIGADAIISHHTHVFSGYEVYKGKPIFYGLGNFIYDWPGKINSDWNIGFVVKLIFKDKIDFEVVPHKQCNDQPGIFHLSIKERQDFEIKLDRLNSIIANGELLERYFAEYCRSVYPMYDAFIEPHFGRIITALRKRGLFPKLLSRKKRLYILNITRCDSHREVLTRMLSQYE